MSVEKFLFVVRYCVGNWLVCRLVQNCLYEYRRNTLPGGSTFVPYFALFLKVRVQKYSSGKATATPLPLQIYYLFNHNCLE